MVEIYDNNYNNVHYVFGYDIKNSESGEIIDFVTCVYSEKTIWQGENVLSTVIVNRRSLKDILEFFGTTKENFISNLTKDNVDVLAIEDAIGDTRGDLIHISLPSRYLLTQKLDSNKKNYYNDSKNDLNVFINKEDYSSAFEYFDVFESKVVDKAYEVLVSGKFLKADNKFENLKSDIENIFNNFERNGFVFD